MIFESADFTFPVPPVVSRARRVLIKPCAAYPAPYPVTTRPEMLATIIASIRKVSDADILLLEGTHGGGPIQPIFQSLSYDFPRVLLVDVKDCTLVEVDNPLPKPFIVPTFWVPNVILSSDYLITVAPLKIVKDIPSLSIRNLLTLLPITKYRGEAEHGWGSLYGLGIDKVLADLYFTLPFDLAVIDGTQKFTSGDDPAEGTSEDYGKIFLGEPFEVDSEVNETLGLESEYLELIKSAKAELEG
ncbi:MAG: DUF362 domain-containing protein [Dehalococcoidales bacterium]|nr:DUF362 domain-containing protein [Dehalococcoidales bacterium]